MTVKVSKGNLKVVPGVANKGYSEAEARAVLSSNGFTKVEHPDSSTNTSNQAQDGKVIMQDPAEGTPRDPATTTIRITVAQYVRPEPDTVRRPRRPPP